MNKRRHKKRPDYLKNKVNKRADKRAELRTKLDLKREKMDN